jgi:uncharacterized repeat protein (TIGR03803 family)
MKSPASEEKAMSNPHCTARRITRKLLFGLASLVLLVAIRQSGHSQTLTTLYSFNGGTDGAFPRAGVILGTDGNLYGMAGAGSEGAGTVFELVSGSDFEVLHNFSGTPDGETPYGGLAFDAKGNLAGTTYGGGAYDHGTVFDMSTTGAETVLYNFPFPGPPSGVRIFRAPHGAGPGSGVVFDAQGNLYSTTSVGSYYAPACFNCGAVFELTPAGTEKLLYSFTGAPTDGVEPGDLIIDAQGNLYGSTQQGGAANLGIVFKVTAAGEETVLHSFGASLDDGIGPLGKLLLDAEGNLYGTTVEGGANYYGTVFKLTPSGEETILYNFGKPPDGAYPSGTLVMDGQGNLYGTTGWGGAYGWGTVFELAPGGAETILYNFTGGTDGADPFAGLLLKDNSLYGTTYMGGNLTGCVNRYYKGCGTVFVLSF